MNSELAVDIITEILNTTNLPKPVKHVDGRRWETERYIVFCNIIRGNLRATVLDGECRRLPLRTDGTFIGDRTEWVFRAAIADPDSIDKLVAWINGIVEQQSRVDLSTRHPVPAVDLTRATGTTSNWQSLHR